MKLKSSIFLFICSISFFAAHAQEATSDIEVSMDSITISSVGNIRMKSGGNGKIYYNDKEMATKGDAGRCATIVVAAYNAGEKSKAGADIICTGTNDNEKIQEAISYISSLGVGGKIQLTEGDYNFSNGVWLGALANNKMSSIAIEGMGDCTTLHRRYSSLPGKSQGLFVFGLPEGVTNTYTTSIGNMKYNGHMDEYSQPSSVPQSFATGYTEIPRLLETVIVENITCENVYVQSNIIIAIGSNLIARSVNIIDGYPSFGIFVNKSSGSNISATIEGCYVPHIEAGNLSNSFIINNISKTISFSGEKTVCTGNIYQQLYNYATNSLVSNNLQVNNP